MNVLQLAAAAVLLGAGYLVLARSGNQSDITPSAFELALRAHLTTLLQVRPRFKEFVLGFPALMLVPALRAGGPRALGLAVRARDRRRPRATSSTRSRTCTRRSRVSVLRLVNGAVIGIVVGAVGVVAYRRFRKANAEAP